MSKKNIDTDYPTEKGDMAVKVSYEMETEGSIQMINCLVKPYTKETLHWAYPRSFTFKSSCKNGRYQALYVENDNVQTVNDAQFADKVYGLIMAKEGQKQNQ